MEKNNFHRHRQGGPEVQLRAGQRSANSPGHPHNLEENQKITQSAALPSRLSLENILNTLFHVDLRDSLKVSIKN